MMTHPDTPFHITREFEETLARFSSLEPVHQLRLAYMILDGPITRILGNVTAMDNGICDAKAGLWTAIDMRGGATADLE